MEEGIARGARLGDGERIAADVVVSDHDARTTLTRMLPPGELEAEVHTADGAVLRTRQQYPPGSPARPPTPDQLAAKLADCVAGLDTDPAEWTWENAAETLRRWLPCQTN